MARSTLHTPEDLLDAAAELFVEGGARAVTMVAVARKAGAPSGSVYHRYPSLGALLGALWLSTSSEFESEYRAIIGPSPTPEVAVESAVWMVDWCRQHPARAAILNAGPRSFEPQAWPKETQDAHRAARRDRDQDMDRLIKTVAETAGVPRDEATFAMFGLPIAVIGGHIRVGEPVPSGASDLVGRLAGRLLRVGLHLT